MAGCHSAASIKAGAESGAVVSSSLEPQSPFLPGPLFGEWSSCHEDAVSASQQYCTQDHDGVWLLHRLAGCERTWPLPRVVYVFDAAWKCVRARGGCSRAAVGGVRMRAHVCGPSGGRSVPWGLFRWPRAVHTFPRTPALYCDYDGRVLLRVVHAILLQLSG